MKEITIPLTGHYTVEGHQTKDKTSAITGFIWSMDAVLPAAVNSYSVNAFYPYLNLTAYLSCTGTTQEETIA